MKALITGLLLTLSIGASAVQIEVYSNVHNQSKHDVSIDNLGFVVNAELGRAAVEFLLWDDSDSGDYKTIVQTVDDLYFDQATGNVMYNNTVCATTRVRRRVIFGRKVKVSKTGACKFNVIKDKVSIDDGFRIKRKNRISVYMNIR